MGWLCAILFFWIAMLFLVSGDDNIKIVNVIDFMIFEIISQILKVKSTAHKIPFVYCTLYIVNNLHVVHQNICY